jgi:hypothetical protein
LWVSRILSDIRSADARIAERAGAGSSVALIVRTLACHCMAM